MSAVRVQEIAPVKYSRAGVDERTYAGVLGKIIGVYYGRPVEGWSYEQLQERFGVVDRYVAGELQVPLIVPDDDISGTFVYARAAADHDDIMAAGSVAVGRSWLNYTIEGKTVLWWGGLCRSTEHTAYLRLKSGIDAPRSGSIELNGRSMAEGVGAQIFIDGWGLMCPGDPDRAAHLARNAARVSHDGLAVSAASFLAAMEALAFEVPDIDALIDSCLPLAGDANLERLVSDVRSVCEAAADWREARRWIEENHGYSRYPGNSPMATNHAAVLMSVLMAGDDFHQSLLICTSAGWDTDSNTGNVGCLNGIRLGLAGIEAGPDLRGPVADRLYAVSAEGGACVTDAVRETWRLALGRARLYGLQDPPARPRFSFDLPGCVQGFEPHNVGTRQALVGIRNDAGHGLTVAYRHLARGAVAALSSPTFAPPEPTSVPGTSYFGVLASPTLYGTQTVRARVRVDDRVPPLWNFFIDVYGDDAAIMTMRGPRRPLERGINNITWQVPPTNGRAIYRLGVELESPERCDGSLVIEAIDWSGAPEDFVLGTAYELTPDLTPWTTDTAWLRTFVSSARNLTPDYTTTFSLSHPEPNGVVTIGTSDWRDYAVSSTITFNQQDAAGLVGRSRGHRRYYAAMLRGQQAMLVRRFDGGETILAETSYQTDVDAVHKLDFTLVGDRLTMNVDGELQVEARDSTFTNGGAGLVVDHGAVLAKGFRVQRRGAS